MPVSADDRPGIADAAADDWSLPKSCLKLCCRALPNVARRHDRAAGAVGDTAGEGRLGGDIDANTVAARDRAGIADVAGKIVTCVEIPLLPAIVPELVMPPPALVLPNTPPTLLTLIPS